MSKYFIVPIRLEEYSLYKCDGVFAGGQPFLKQKDDTYLLKPNEDCYIGIGLDGQKSFIPISSLSSNGFIVEPNETGETQINLNLGVQDENKEAKESLRKL